MFTEDKADNLITEYFLGDFKDVEVDKNSAEYLAIKETLTKLLAVNSEIDVKFYLNQQLLDDKFEVESKKENIANYLTRMNGIVIEKLAAENNKRKKPVDDLPPTFRTPC